jgi:phosphatidylcholine synthase
VIFSDWTKEKIFAWAVHLFTASGVVFAALALLAILDNQPQHCVLWLSVSLVIDGVDGTLARKFRVKNVLPQVDGSALDLIIDYLNYVFSVSLMRTYFHCWRSKKNQ